MGWELPLCLFRAMTFKQASSVRPEGCLVSLSGQRRNLKLVPLAIAALASPGTTGLEPAASAVTDFNGTDSPFLIF